VSESRAQPAAVSTVVIETVYDGPDLEWVAGFTGRSVDGVIAAHSSNPWRVAFCGFAPGFAYLAGGAPGLTVPRRDSPRPEVPCGAVGLAGPYSGIYPRPSPGGWQLIGRTEVPLWDARRDPPALLRPGMAVEFRAVRPRVTASSVKTIPQQRVSHRVAADRTLTVVRPGLQCLLQDLGRPGHADMGVSRSGAADRGALRRANQFVGNAPDAAVLELLLGGAEFRADGELTIALAGAPVAVTLSAPQATPRSSEERAPTMAPYLDVSEPMERPLTVPAGSRVRLGRPPRGLRTYLAVRGGIDVEPVLGSRSTDLLARLGPAPVRAGDALPIGRSAAGLSAGRNDEGAAFDPDGGCTILPGPQRDWFSDEAWNLLANAAWTVTPDSNRVAARLSGPALHRSVADELPSQGLVRGAVQVPPSGELVAFLADHPVTGGYPVIAVLTEAAADRLAQCRPGAVVRFRDAAAQEVRQARRVTCRS
jgi:biotin-dependent carboxylase-like uncharacterized protein